MTAARTGKVDAVRVLLARGADVHAKEPRRGQTALMWAAAEGHVAVIEELIKAGADFRTPLDSGFTPLMFAVRQGHIAAVKALLKAGVDVNEPVQVRANPKLPEGERPIRAGTTPLDLAVANAHFELASELLDAGADPNSNRLGYTVLHMLVLRAPARHRRQRSRSRRLGHDVESRVREAARRQRRGRQRADHATGQPHEHALPRDRRDTVSPGGDDGRRRVHEDARRARCGSVGEKRRGQHGADDGGRARHAVAGRRRRHRRGSDRGDAGGARPRRRHQRGRCQRRDRHARRRVQEPSAER